MRKAALVELRHRIGEGFDDEQPAYNLFLLHNYSKSHAEIVVKLLHNFTPRPLALPDTYER